MYLFTVYMNQIAMTPKQISVNFILFKKLGNDVANLTKL